jgi:uncharacterized protein YkwD
MSESTGTDRSSLFGLLLILLALLTLFYLIRPPFLMLWRYGFGFDAKQRQVEELPPLPIWSPSNSTRAPKPIQPPSLPVSLDAVHTPPRWTAPVINSPDMVDLSARIFELTNDERVQRRQAALQEDPVLAEIATRHSKDMLDQNYLAHESKDGDGPAQRVGRLHRTLFGLTSENVALYDSAAEPTDQLASQFISQWMNSLGHRRNILSSDSTHLGVGCLDGLDTRVSGNRMRKCTQLFSNAYAYADAPIPNEVAVGGSIVIALSAIPGHALPTAVVQTDLQTDRPAPKGTVAQLINRGGVAEGQLKVVGPPALYGLSIHVPMDDGSGSYTVIPGPYFRVR